MRNVILSGNSGDLRDILPLRREIVQTRLPRGPFSPWLELLSNVSEVQVTGTGRVLRM